MSNWEWAALVGAAVIALFCVWVSVAVIWNDRPPVVYDERKGRYTSARITKQRREGR